MKELKKYLQLKTKQELEEELMKIYSDFELVKDHYDIKLGGEKIDSKIIEKYQLRIHQALNPDSEWQGGFDIEKVEKILGRLNKKSNKKYYFEIAIYSIDECTKLANCYGGSYGEEFYLYFSGVFGELIQEIEKEGLKKEYRNRLKIVVNESFDGYSFQDDLKEIFENTYKE